MAGIQCWRKIEGKACVFPEFQGFCIIYLQGEPLNSRNKHTAVVVGNRMLMFGGYSLQQRQFYNDITAFNFGNVKFLFSPSVYSNFRDEGMG